MIHQGSGRALPRLLAPCLLAAGLGLGGTGHAQSSCSSDGQPVPTALVERFINADCADCWADPATPRVSRGALALDWVTTGGLGEDAPLSAVASRDALKRLQALGHQVPPTRWARTNPVAMRQAGVLRVAHGLPLSGYVGASIELKTLPRQAGSPPWSAWLVLVESLPAGIEGSPVARNLVRNLLQTHWDGREQLLKNERLRFEDSRAMNIPTGMNTDRLRLIGWVQDANGRIVAAAQSRCRPP